MTQLKRYIRFREYFDQENNSHVVEGELGLTAKAIVSEALMFYSRDKKEPMLRAKDEIVRSIVAGIYGPVVQILDEALDEVNTADVWKRNDPYFNARLAVEDLLLRILSKVRDL
jgi:hypothetical protein